MYLFDNIIIMMLNNIKLNKNFLHLIFLYNLFIRTNKVYKKLIDKIILKSYNILLKYLNGISRKPSTMGHTKHNVTDSATGEVFWLSKLHNLINI